MWGSPQSRSIGRNRKELPAGVYVGTSPSLTKPQCPGLEEVTAPLQPLGSLRHLTSEGIVGMSTDQFSAPHTMVGNTYPLSVLDGGWLELEATGNQVN